MFVNAVAVEAEVKAGLEQLIHQRGDRSASGVYREAAELSGLSPSTFRLFHQGIRYHLTCPVADRMYAAVSELLQGE